MLRATERIGLYTHGLGVTAAYYSRTLPQIYKSFADTGNGVGEVGFGQLQNQVYMNGAYLAFYPRGGVPADAPGQHPWAMLDNGQDDFLPAQLADGSLNITNHNGTNQTVERWGAELAAAQAHGIGLVVPIITPNDDVGLQSDPATSPDWARARDIALAMRSVAIDAPPHYFMHSNVAVPGAPASYRRWLVQFVHWALASNLRIFWIISPDQSGSAFLADTQAEIAFLRRNQALPHHWIVENYFFPNAVAGATLQSGGAGYTHATVRVSAPNVAWGTQATMNATVRDGRVVELTPVDQGSGYLRATLTIEGDGHGAVFRPVVNGRNGRATGGAEPPGNPRLPNPNVVGTESMTQSVANVALWVARNAPTHVLPAGCSTAAP